jgi:hypothetical protein
MPSPNNPKSSAQLIREHSKARYITVNDGLRGFHTVRLLSWALRGDAEEQLVRQYR